MQYNWADFEVKLNFLDYFKTYHKSTEDEKQLLLDAMHKDEYEWDPQKKRIKSI